MIYGMYLPYLGGSKLLVSMYDIWTYSGLIMEVGGY